MRTAAKAIQSFFMAASGCEALGLEGVKWAICFVPNSKGSDLAGYFARSPFSSTVSSTTSPTLRTSY